MALSHSSVTKNIYDPFHFQLHCSSNLKVILRKKLFLDLFLQQNPNKSALFFLRKIFLTLYLCVMLSFEFFYDCIRLEFCLPIQTAGGFKWGRKVRALAHFPYFVRFSAHLGNPGSAPERRLIVDKHIATQRTHSSFLEPLFLCQRRKPTLPP